jgi:hypothetical protein
MQEKQSFFISFYFLHGIKIVDRCNYLLNRHYKEIEDALKWGKKYCSAPSGQVKILSGTRPHYSFLRINIVSR